MKKQTKRGNEGYDGWLKQKQNTSNLRDKHKPTIDEWIANNKKKRKRQPRLTEHYTIPSNEVPKTIKENNKIAEK